ncbi:ATP-binding protein [Micromonospora krabiensis]|uniref:ATPase family associated with various cellular activities (AAA) n=1 Tax=Micromonospora krabiensis TaxID=307121 RepID=A0A1C3N4A2_9ACTN|nr:ATP-binding protein [Micromonospora krabiensis]SBV27403.1 ATPase family associated with various cellular activities (AAA) [Micromonospora krabiensis]
MSSDALIDSLSSAVDARPDDLPLRLHLATLLLDAGRGGEAIAQIGQALAREPGSDAAQALMQRALGAAVPPPPPAPPAVPAAGPAATAPQPPAQRPAPAGPTDDPLAAYEQELADVVPPRFARAGDEPEPVTGDDDRVYDVETSTIRLADVGGMSAVKERLELAFLGPLRNPELRRMYGKSLRGGLMLYGPPGCGKTFLARAVAGEMGAKFVSLSIVDVLDMWMGNSERNLHELFEAARRNAPCVLFLDEVDALGHKRSQVSSSSMRTLGNQLLAELDGMEGSNEGVFVLAATNTPWDVDPALRRPGRLDRVVLVLPPDAEARAAILEYHLRERPIAGIDLRKVVAATEDFSGADLAHLCETAAEYAMADSVRSGEVRMIEQRDVERALKEVRPSTRPWMATARNVAMFANEGGVYDDLVAYLKKRKLI